MNDVQDEECIIIELKYSPLTFLYESNRSGTKLVQMANVCKLEYMQERVLIGSKADEMKERDINIDEMYAQIVVQKDKYKKVPISRRLTNALDQAKMYARALPVMKDTKIVVAAFVGYGPKVCNKLDVITVKTRRPR